MPSNQSRGMKTPTPARGGNIVTGNEEGWRHAKELGTSSALLMYLSAEGSERLTVGQAAFFLLAAAMDAKGTPGTRTTLLSVSEGDFRASTRNSYRQLLEPSRVYPNALGWLTTEENPLDSREQFLRLTKEGKDVVAGAMMALEPLRRKA